MRKGMMLVCLLFVSVTLFAADNKIASEWKCGKPEGANPLAIGDQPNHTYATYQFKCTATKGEIAGVKEKEGSGTEFAEVTGDKLSGHGVFVESLAGGDKMYVSYQVTATLKNGQLQSGSNKWQITGGTGKLKGSKGGGTCTGKPNSDGTTTFTCTGTQSSGK